ncbi:MAG: MlaD family protein [Spirochaetes bacterium]|nr:MlaD family protein [Spirochaetota bacterium]
MPFTFNRFQKGVAIFIVFGFFLFLLILIFILKGNNIFEKKIKYFTYFQQTYGLSSGSQIKYKGLNIGKIISLKLDNNDNILVNFVIYKNYNYLIRKDTVLKISSALLGGGGLTVIPGKGEEVEPGSLVFSSDMQEGMNILAQNATVQKSGDLTVQAQQVLDMILEMKPVIYKTLVNINNITSDVKSITGSLKGGEDSKLGKEIFNILSSINNIINSVNSSVKSLNDIVYKLNSTLNSKDNSIGSILNDDNRLYNSVKSTLDTLNSSISNINNLISKFNNLPEDLKKIIVLLQENLIQLKYVLENLPLIPKSETKSSSSNINVGR